MTRSFFEKTPRAKARTAPAPVSDVISSGRLGAVVAAALLGAVLLYGTAFSPVAHEVAHDTRHAIGFPCH